MELATERLRLREFVGNDYAAVHRYAGDPEVTRYMDWGPNDFAATRLFLSEVEQSVSRYPRIRYALAVVLRELDELIGSVELQVRSEEGGPEHAWLRSRALQLGERLCHRGRGRAAAVRVRRAGTTHDLGDL